MKQNKFYQINVYINKTYVPKKETSMGKGIIKQTVRTVPTHINRINLQAQRKERVRKKM
jgi:hypothetical protein